MGISIGRSFDDKEREQCFGERIECGSLSELKEFIRRIKCFYSGIVIEAEEEVQ